MVSNVLKWSQKVLILSKHLKYVSFYQLKNKSQISNFFWVGVHWLSKILAKVDYGNLFAPLNKLLFDDGALCPLFPWGTIQSSIAHVGNYQKFFRFAPISSIIDCSAIWKMLDICHCKWLGTFKVILSIFTKNQSLFDPQA